MEMISILEYEKLVAEINQSCSQIISRYGDQITCSKGCAGNCCRIHLSISAVESFHISRALLARPKHFSSRIRQKAGRSTAIGSCPLLNDGECCMYSDRLLLCRTHGLPMTLSYRGQKSVGCCQKNFRQSTAIAEDACIDLDRLNRRLASIDLHFRSEYKGNIALKKRYLIGEALLLEF